MCGAYLPVHCLPVFIPAGNLRCPQGWGEEQQQQQSRAAPHRARSHLGVAQWAQGRLWKQKSPAFPQAAGERPQDWLEACPPQSEQKNGNVTLVNLVQPPEKPQFLDQQTNLLSPLCFFMQPLRWAQPLHHSWPGVVPNPQFSSVPPFAHGHWAYRDWQQQRPLSHSNLLTVG